MNIFLSVLMIFLISCQSSQNLVIDRSRETKKPGGGVDTKPEPIDEVKERSIMLCETGNRSSFMLHTGYVAPNYRPKSFFFYNQLNTKNSRKLDLVYSPQIIDINNERFDIFYIGQWNYNSEAYLYRSKFNKSELQIDAKQIKKIPDIDSKFKWWLETNSKSLRRLLKISNFELLSPALNGMYEILNLNNYKVRYFGLDSVNHINPRKFKNILIFDKYNQQTQRVEQIAYSLSSKLLFTAVSQTAYASSLMPINGKWLWLEVNDENTKLILQNGSRVSQSYLKNFLPKNARNIAFSSNISFQKFSSSSKIVFTAEYDINGAREGKVYWLNVNNNSFSVYKKTDYSYNLLRKLQREDEALLVNIYRHDANNQVYFSTKSHLNYSHFYGIDDNGNMATAAETDCVHPVSKGGINAY